MFFSVNRIKICVALIVIIALLQMISLFKIFDFQYLIALCGMLIVFLGIKIMSNNFRKMVGVFLFLGTLLNVYTQQSLAAWVNGINYMLNIAAILVIMQLFVIPIKIGNYAAHFNHLLLKVFDNERTVYFFSSVIISMFSTFLLFGTIPVMLSLLGESLKKIVGDYDKFMSTALTRGYAVAVMWAPGAVNILLVMNTTKTKWIDIFPIGFGLSVLGLLLSYFLQKKYLSKAPMWQQACCRKTAVESEKKADKAALKKIVNIIFLVILLIVLIFFFDAAGIGNNTSRVMLAGLLLVSGWLWLLRDEKDFKNAVSEYFNVSLVKTIDLAILYVALGIFSKALETSGILEKCLPYIGILSAQSPLAIIPITVLIIMLLAMIGMHPFIVIIILGQILMSLNLPLSPLIIAIILLFGSMLSYMLSPFAGMVLTTAKFLDVSIYEVGLKWNGLFGLILFLLGNCIIIGCHLYGF